MSDMDNKVLAVLKIGFKYVRKWEGEDYLFCSFNRLIDENYRYYDSYYVSQYYYCTVHDYGRVVWFEYIDGGKVDGMTTTISFSDVFEILTDEEKDIAIFNFDLLTGGEECQ